MTDNLHRSFNSVGRLALPICVLGFLWFTLINHLRVEWTVNPQYRYGWAVPALCLYLVWRKKRQRKPLDYVAMSRAPINLVPATRQQTASREQGAAGGEQGAGSGERGAGSGGGTSEMGDGRWGTSNIEHRTSNVERFDDEESEVRHQRLEVSERQEGRPANGTTDNRTERRETNGQQSQVEKLPAPRSADPHPATRFRLPSPIIYLLVAGVALVWLPTRLIQEANPEWRLISWALALEVVGLTLLVLIGWEREERSAGQRAGSRRIRGQKSEVRGQKSEVLDRIPGFGFFSDFGFRISDFVFPLCFFLVAVPWPTLIESPLIQFLTRANASATVEIVTSVGLPALQRGNVIEVGTGVVGIDDACSGIRSFQATLMIALFLGGLYQLSWPRRLLLVLGGSVLAGAFNVARTSVLVWIASRKGLATMSAWHDPTGVIILVADFIFIWLAALALRQSGGAGSGERGAGSRERGVGSRERGAGSGEWGVGSGDGRLETEDGSTETSNVDPRPQTPDPGPSTLDSRPSAAPDAFRGPWSLCALAVWLVLVEIGTEVWYRSHEAHLPKTVAWKVELPQQDPTFRPLPFSDATRQFLRYDEGFNGTWIEGGDKKLQAIFLRWNPGRTAPHLAKNHTPEVCLTAAGHQLVAQTDLRLFGAHGLQLPFRSYVLKDEHGPVHVFYCLWEDRADAQFFNTQNLTYANRLEPVLAGRRNSGQRSLEIAIWGLDDPQEADAALVRELDRLVRVGE